MNSSEVLTTFSTIKRNNLTVPELVEHAFLRDEVKFSYGGAVVAETGKHTGRSPQDKFIVRDTLTEASVCWENNTPMSEMSFEALQRDFEAHASDRNLYIQDLHAGADLSHQIGVRIQTELAWHALFIRNLLIKPTALRLPYFSADLTIINFPSFKADPKKHGSRTETVIACNFKKGLILIGGTGYAGEIKKAVFTFLNFLYPEKGVLPMHCAANVGKEGDVALFFGLSGTGKTTLSADPNRSLVGDDEHGWGQSGIFNFEGGCYAKTANLSRVSEPQIYRATQRFGTVLENVAFDNGSRNTNFADTSRTENARAAYALDAIENVTLAGIAQHPSTIVMLTCDAFGVLPPVAKLTAEQAVEYFLIGYTAKVAGTERGVTGPTATFSACFGVPFMPRSPNVYGELLRKMIVAHHPTCWLLNTGWVGGGPDIGKRIPLAITRTILELILNGKLNRAPMRKHAVFEIDIPEEVAGVPNPMLNPEESWDDPQLYWVRANSLKAQFDQNLKQQSH